MTIFLIRGDLTHAATSHADAIALITALADPDVATNSAVIDRVSSRLERLVLGDNGKPLVVSSIDDAAGTISPWVTDNTQTLVFSVGDPSASSPSVYATAGAFSISGNTRTSTIALNSAALSEALGGKGRRSHLGTSSDFVAHLRLTAASGRVETVGLLDVTVLAGVLAA